MEKEMTDLMLQPHPEGIPLPHPTPLSQAYWDGCARGELLYQHCTNCGRALFNPAPICRWCTSSALEWRRSAGTGSVYSWTVVWRPATPKFVTPYVPAIIDLDEGYQMVANIVGCEPDAIRLNMQVAAEFHPIGGGMALPYFRPR
jgi:uncharacterized OB-fold protein